MQSDNKMSFTKENVDTVDNLPLDAHLSLLRGVNELVNAKLSN